MLPHTHPLAFSPAAFPPFAAVLGTQASKAPRGQTNTRTARSPAGSSLFIVVGGAPIVVLAPSPA